MGSPGRRRRPAPWTMTDMGDGYAKLAQHLLTTVRVGLNGRGQRDLIDRIPNRTFFSGVLAPVAESGSGSPARTPRPEPGSALGIDFRARTTGEHDVTLVMQPKFAVYAPVFPSLETALLANDSIISAREPAPEVGTAEETAPDDTPDETGDTEDLTSPDETEEIDTPPPSTVQTLLPVVWRRYEVKIAPISVTFGVTDEFNRNCGKTEINQGLAA